MDQEEGLTVPLVSVAPLAKSRDYGPKRREQETHDLVDIGGSSLISGRTEQTSQGQHGQSREVRKKQNKRRTARRKNAGSEKTGTLLEWLSWPWCSNSGRSLWWPLNSWDVEGSNRASRGRSTQNPYPFAVAAVSLAMIGVACLGVLRFSSASRTGK